MVLPILGSLTAITLALLVIYLVRFQKRSQALYASMDSEEFWNPVYKAQAVERLKEAFNSLGYTVLVLAFVTLFLVVATYAVWGFTKHAAA